jgi:hypothetical protein
MSKSYRNKLAIFCAIYLASGVAYPITIDRAAKSIVQIEAKIEQNGKEICMPLGMGNFISSDGWILTCLHVVNLNDSEIGSIKDTFNLKLPTSLYAVSYNCQRIPIKLKAYESIYDYAFLKASFEPEYFVNLEECNSIVFDSSLITGNDINPNYKDSVVILWPVLCDTSTFKYNKNYGLLTHYTMRQGYIGLGMVRCFIFEIIAHKGMSGSLIYQKTKNNYEPIALAFGSMTDSLNINPDTLLWGTVLDSSFMARFKSLKDDSLKVR